MELSLVSLEAGDVDDDEEVTGKDVVREELEDEEEEDEGEELAECGVGCGGGVGCCCCCTVG